MKSSTPNNQSVDQVLAQDHPHRRGSVVAIAVIVVIALAIWLMLPANNQATLQYTTVEATQGDLTIEVTATGTLEPLNQVEVGSEVSGTIDEVLVDFNDRVSQGQVLARLNTDEQGAKVVQVKAALEVAQARVLQAQATVLESDLKLKRCQTLATKGLCPPQDMDAAQATYARAKADEASAVAQVSQARATLDAEQSRLAKTVIRSPIDGIVLKRQIEPGQTVAASLQAPVLFTLAENLAQMELKVAVDEADIGKVREGQLATFTVDAYGERVFPATITQVRLAPLSEGGVVSYETILALDNAELLLRPGMTATARIIVQQINDALLVPNAALRFVPPTPKVQQESSFMDQLLPRWGSRERPARQNNKVKQVWGLENNQAKAIEVKTGPSDGRMTQILESELQAGMLVITDATGKRS
jgi:HlyD family secretion protein